MKIAVIGAGAVGCMLAHFFDQAGAEVTLIARESACQIINDKGLGVVVDEQRGQHSIKCSSVLDFYPDLAIFAVKTQDVEHAFRQNADFLPYETPVLMLQNGVQAENIMSVHVDPEGIFSGIVLFWSHMIDQAVVEMYGPGPILLGRSFYMNNPVIHQLGELLAGSTNVIVMDRAMDHKWFKLLLNMCNVPSALVNRPIAEAYQDDDIARLATSMLKESYHIFQQSDINMRGLHLGAIASDDFLEMIEQEDVAASRAVQERFSQYAPILLGSMLQSLRAGKDSEIDYINGEAVQMARNIDLPAPVNRFIVDSVHEIERTGSFYNKEVLLQKSPL